MTALTTSSPPVVPDHEILRCIGRGSYGEVWLARNILGTYRAIKTVRRSAFTSARPYEREFTGIQRFEPVSRSHEALMDILQVGRTESEGFFYYVMELADDAGGAEPLRVEHYVPLTLAESLERRRRLPVEDCLLLFRSLAIGLGHLHRAGLVHRDIKPSNIIFVHGRAKFADIGLVTTADASISYVGTEGFIPPEGAGTVAADLYSLGKVLYESATGKDRTEFPSLPAPGPDLADYGALLELNAIWLKACARTAGERYASADEMASDLALLQAGRSVKRLRVVERRMRRARQFAATIALLALIAAAAGFIERQTRLESDRLRIRAELAEREVRRQLEGSQVARARAVLHSPQIGRRETVLQLLSEIRSEDLRVEARGYAASALVLPDLARVSTQAPSPPPLQHEWRVEPNADGSIAIHEGGTNNPRSVMLPSQGEPVREPLQLHLGHRFLYAGYGRFVERLWDVEARRLIATLDTNYYELAFRPGQAQVAVAYVGGVVRLHDLPSWRIVQEWSMPGDEHRVRWNPTGTHLLLLNASGIAASATIGNSTLEPIKLPPASIAQTAVWSPDGQHFALGCSDGYVRVRGTVDWSDFAVLSRHEAQLIDMAFLPPFPWLLTSSWDGTTRLWDWQAGTELGRIEATSYGVHYDPKRHEVQWRLGSEPDGSRWELMGGEFHRQIVYGDPRTLGGPFAVAWSSDSTLMATCDSTDIRLWRVADGTELLRVPGAAEALWLAPGNRALLANTRGSIRRWELLATNSGGFQVTHETELAPADILDKLAASRDGSVLAWLGPNTVELLRGNHRQRLEHTQEAAEKIAVSPDGRWAAVGTRNHVGVQVLNLESGAVQWKAGIRYGTHPTFSNDSRWVAVGTETGCHVFDAATGRLRWHHAPLSEREPSFWEVAFSPDDSLVAWTPKSSSLQLLDAHTGAEVLTLDYPSRRYITQLAFSPDGRWLAETSNKHAIHLWDILGLKRRLESLHLGWGQSPGIEPRHE